MLGLSHVITAIRALAPVRGARNPTPAHDHSVSRRWDVLQDGGSFLAAELGNNRGHAFIVGAPGTGKTTLIEQIFSKLPECAVYLKVGPQALPGWAEAPFHGTFYPANGTASYGEDLEDILRQRPVGRFQLDFPLTAIFGSELLTAALKRGLAQSLQESAVADHATHLSILVDDSERLVDQTTLLELMTRNTSTWTLIASRNNVDASEFAHAPYCQHVIGLHMPEGTALVTEDTLGIPEGTLAGVPIGSFWYSTRKGQTGRQFKFCDKRPAA